MSCPSRVQRDAAVVCGKAARCCCPNRSAHTWQSDVETVHRLVEDEFFDREEVRSVEEFWAKVTTNW